MTPARRGRLAPYVMTFVAVLVSALVATFVFGKDYRSVSASKKYFHRHAFVPSFDPITDALVGYAPSAMSTNPGLPSDKVRTIEIFPHSLVLLAGGAPVRTIALAKPVTTLKGVAERIGDPGWIAVDGTTLEAKTAIIAQPGSFVRIAKPETTELVLHSTPGIFLGSVGARLLIDGVAVHGTDRTTPEISKNSRMDLGRPFVVAYSHSRMDIRDSSFRDLGRDWNASYGVSWSLGSTGSAVGSTFERNFIGVYTDHAHDLLVKGNVFRHNTLYGVDPHSYSVRMDIEDNLAESNGRHGIIFSDHVTDGIVRNNTTRDNDLNGIMMDASSTENRIVGNLTERNRGDGIVLASSPHNVISGNRILDNRIGLQARGPRDDVTLAGNEFAGNAMASQGLHVPAGNSVHGNGGQWKPATVRAIWLAAGPILLLLVLLTMVAQRKYNRPKAFHEVLA
jgi:poly(beta-D-mannuronate) C5 epimerase